MSRLEKLQSEYNELHNKMGYCKNPETIKSINNQLDKLTEEMTKIIKKDLAN